MRKAFVIFMSLVLIFTIQVFADEEIKPATVKIEGAVVEFSDQGAYYDAAEETVFLPIALLCKELGTAVNWDGDARKVTIHDEQKEIVFFIGKDNILVNTETVPLSSATKIVGGRSIVPVDFVEKVLGKEFKWDQETNSIDIYTDPYISMASTIGPIDAGIVGKLAEQYYASTGIRVRYVGAGTGKAIEMSKSGDYDIVMVHAKALEEQFVADGFGTERIDLMYNDFVIVGPENDPAGIKGMNPTQALNKIKEIESLFISRGDNSGTHVKEMELWKEAELTPEGNWYNVWEGGNKGNAATLRYTNERQAYTIIDRATYLTLKEEINLTVLVEGYESLLNFITLIPVNPEKFPQVKHDMVMDFVNFATSEKAQTIIRDFKVDVYGEPLFFPNSVKWREKVKSNI